MKLYNQIDRPLKWDMAEEWFECEPYSSVEIPDDLVAACKNRGLPLGPAPVAPEQQAHNSAERALAEAEKAEVLQLKEALALAEAGLAERDRNLEREMSMGMKLKGKADALEAKVRELNDQVKRDKQDYQALEAKMLELAEQLAELKSEEKRKPKRSAKPEA